MRIAKMPYVQWDDHKKRFIVRRRVPADVQAIIGGNRKVVTHKFRQGIDERAANDLSIDIVRGWEAQWAAVRAGVPPDSIAAPACGCFVAYSKTVCTVRQPGRALELNGGPARLATGRHGEDIVIEHLPVEAPQLEALQPPPVAMTPYPACNTETVLTCLATDRETPPKNKGLRAKRRAMADLFAYLRKPDDVTQITGSDMQRYKEHLVAARGNTLARKYLEDMCAVLRVAADNNKIGKADNPANAITLPGKRSGTPRPAFSEDEARILLTAARDHAKPIVKWGTRLGALGLITSEFADASVADVAIIDGVPCLHLRGDNRSGDARELKTVQRGRQMPLPSRWADEFLAYADRVRREHGDKAPLFPEIPADRDGRRNTKASAEIMAFIRGCGIENVTDPETDKVIVLKDSYSWRKRFASRLENIKEVIDPATSQPIANKSDRQRYLCGHAAIDVHGKVYLDHPPTETRHIIDAIPWPEG
jgi:hypothetical protein